MAGMKVEMLVSPWVAKTVGRLVDGWENRWVASMVGAMVENWVDQKVCRQVVMKVEAKEPLMVVETAGAKADSTVALWVAKLAELWDDLLVGRTAEELAEEMAVEMAVELVGTRDAARAAG